MYITIFDSLLGDSRQQRRDTLAHEIYAALCISHNLYLKPDSYDIVRSPDAREVFVEDQAVGLLEYQYESHNGPLADFYNYNAVIFIGQEFIDQLSIIESSEGKVSASSLSLRGCLLAKTLIGIPDDYMCTYSSVVIPPASSGTGEELPLTMVYSYKP